MTHVPVVCVVNYKAMHGVLRRYRGGSGTRDCSLYADKSARWICEPRCTVHLCQSTPIQQSISKACKRTTSLGPEQAARDNDS
eukprot:2599775-Rhodomonas_salina.2